MSSITVCFWNWIVAVFLLLVLQLLFSSSLCCVHYACIKLAPRSSKIIWLVVVSARFRLLIFPPCLLKLRTNQADRFISPKKREKPQNECSFSVNSDSPWSSLAGNFFGILEKAQYFRADGSVWTICFQTSLSLRYWSLKTSSAERCSTVSDPTITAQRVYFWDACSAFFYSTVKMAFKSQWKGWNDPEDIVRILPGIYSGPKCFVLRYVVVLVKLGTASLEDKRCHCFTCHGWSFLPLPPTTLFYKT